MTEVWLRNPWNYIREVTEVGHCWMAWDRGLLVKRGDLDVRKFSDENVPSCYDYRNLLIGEQGAAEVDRQTTMRRPRAVYPVWDYTAQSWNELERMVQDPRGEDPKWYNNALLLPDQRPVQGQEHRVVVIRPPDFNGSLEAKAFYPRLADLQMEFPEAIIHLHGSYSFRVMFGFGYRSSDIDPSERRGQRVYLPMGKTTKPGDANKFRQWITLLGARVDDLKVPRNVCMFNVRSALWAGSHYGETIAFRTASSELDRKPTLTSYSPGAAVSTEDKFLCDRCSLAVSCKYYREGAVCSLPGSESVELSRFFATRDSDIIVAGLTRILGVQSDRLESGIESEKLTGELDPEVTRIADSLFERALKLAKLLNPALDPKRPLVSVNTTGPTQVNAGSGAGVNVQELVGQVMGELMAKGVPRENITAEMIEAHIVGDRPAPAL